LQQLFFFVFSCLSSPIANFNVLAESPMSDTMTSIEICHYTTPSDYEEVTKWNIGIHTSDLTAIGIDLRKQNDNSCFMYYTPGLTDHYLTAYKTTLDGKLQSMVRWSTNNEILHAKSIKFVQITKSGLRRGVLAQGD
jgi:hypothetical protein